MLPPLKRHSHPVRVRPHRPGCSPPHLWAQTLIRHGIATPSAAWHWSPEQTQTLHAHLTCLVAPAPWTLRPMDGTPPNAMAVCWDTPPRPYPAAMCAFLHALRVGAPWRTALNLFRRPSRRPLYRRRPRVWRARPPPAVRPAYPLRPPNGALRPKLPDALLRVRVAGSHLLHPPSALQAPPLPPRA